MPGGRGQQGCLGPKLKGTLLSPGPMGDRIGITVQELFSAAWREPSLCPQTTPSSPLPLTVTPVAVGCFTLLLLPRRGLWASRYGRPTKPPLLHNSSPSQEPREGATVENTILGSASCLSACRPCDPGPAVQPL